MDIYGANPVDLAVLIIVLISGLIALVRGFVAEVLTIAGLVVATAAAIYGLPLVEPHVLPYLKSVSEKESVVKAAVTGTSAVVLFTGTLIVASIITWMISRRIHKSNLSLIDRSLGFLFGLVRGGIIVTLLFICVSVVFPPPKEGEEISPGSMQAVIRDARTGPALGVMAGFVTALAPDKGLTIEDLTKVDTIKDLIQPQPETRPTRSDENRGYGEPARQGLNDMINRNTTEATP